jgi:hypothetical protein
MQQVASEMNRSKRQLYELLPFPTRGSEIVWQVTSYSMMSGNGSLLLIRGKTTTLPVTCTAKGLQRGSFRVTHSCNGKLLH